MPDTIETIEPTATEYEVTTSYTPTNLYETVFILDLKLGKPSFSRPVPTSMMSVKMDNSTDMSWLRSAKKILEGDEVKALNALHRELRLFAVAYSVPNEQFRSGMYLMTMGQLEKVRIRMELADTQIAELVKALTENYDKLKEEAKIRLGILYNESEYPSVSKLVRAYSIDWKFTMLSTPEGMKQVSVELFERERKKLQKMVEQAAEDSKVMLAEQSKDLLGKIVERLTPDENGKGKKFHDSILANVTEFLNMFDARNLSGDQDLSKLMENVRCAIAGKTGKDIRSSVEVAEDIRAAMTQVSTRLDDMIVDRPSRGFNFDED